MFFFFCGEHTFRKEVPGYEGIVCQCHHCGNMAGHVIKSHPWFTVCFIVRARAPLFPPKSHLSPVRAAPDLPCPPQPLIPFSIKGYKDVSCHICSFHQPLDNRPDVMAMANGGQPQPQQQQPPPQQRPQYG